LPVLYNEISNGSYRKVNLMKDLQQELFLIADEMRSMATQLQRFAGDNVYQREHGHHLMDLAAQVAALADHRPADALRADFAQDDALTHISPAIGVEAAVLNPQGEILLIQRRDNAHWALPGGFSEIGRTLAESALRELWEEAGLRGRTTGLIGVWDGVLSKTYAKLYVVHVVFRVECDELMPEPGIEALAARFFAPDNLPDVLHPGHRTRIARVFAHTDTPFVDQADTRQGELPTFQRRSPVS
jgi:ADP-ribose pyrophosphatase YjhB (NUDIX family)